MFPGLYLDLFGARDKGAPLILASDDGPDYTEYSVILIIGPLTQRSRGSSYGTISYDVIVIRNVMEPFRLHCQIPHPQGKPVSMTVQWFQLTNSKRENAGPN